MQLNSVFIKGIVTLITGNAVAFIIPVLLYPIMSRVFTPEDYALFGLYLSIYTVLEIGSAGRYDFAIVLPQKEDDAINLVGGGFAIALLYALAVLVVVFLTNELIADILNNPRLSSWLYLLPFGLISVSVSKLLNSWLIRKKAFRAASVNKATQKLGESSTQLAFGFLMLGNGLILGDVSGRIINAIVSYYQALNFGFSNTSLKMSSMKTELKKYVEFPKYSILPSILNALGGMMPVFIISSYHSIAVSGSYNFSRIILSVPFALISTGISQVLMQEISERMHKKMSIHHELRSLAIRLCGLSVIGVLIIVLAGGDLFGLVFGEKWRTSGEYTSVLIFSYAISFVVSPFSIILVVLRKIKIASAWQIFYFFAILILWFLKDLSIDRFLISLVVIDVISYLIYGRLIYNAVREYESGLSPMAP